MKNNRKILLILAMGSFIGCSSSDPFADSDLSSTDGKAKIEVKADSDKSVDPDQKHLHQAKIWQRMDQLENKLLRQQEKIQLLEQGLILGIVPDKLKGKSLIERRPTQSTSIDQPVKKPKALVRSQPEKLPQTDVSKVSSSKSKDNGEYKKHLQAARELYSSGSYSKAYLAFGRLQQDYDEIITGGEPQYWLGRCWYRLKDFEAAEEHFGKFIKANPQNPWTPSAKYFLAQVEFQLDYKEKAVKRLEGLIKDYPYDGTTEAAKELLSRLKDEV